MLTGAILAGGKNKRMEGKLKALLPFFGQSLIEKQIEEMNRICDEVIVVTNEPELILPVLERRVRIITDYIPKRGPLSGMHAALSLAKHEHVWVSGCHMPFLNADAALYLLEEKLLGAHEAVIPEVNGHHVLLHGLYDKRCADFAGALLEAGEVRTEQLLQLIKWQPVNEALLEERGISNDFAYKIDSPQDYMEALERYSGRYTHHYGA